MSAPPTPLHASHYHVTSFCSSDFCQVIGDVWHHAHEWIRANLREIVRVYASIVGEGVDIAGYFGGLPPVCFDNAESTETQPAGWKQVVGDPPLTKAEMRSGKTPPCEEWLGTMYHAFPQTQMTHDTSWARDPYGMQYLMLMSDGDLGMLGGLGRALGAGKAFLDPSLIKRSINACGFHKPRAMEKNINLKLNALKACLKRDASKKRAVLRQDDTYQTLFGNLVDECLQTDCPTIGRAAWALVLQKCDVYELHGLRDHLERYHNPETGRQGVWGRWNHIQQKATMPVNENLVTALTTVGDVTRGTASTANGIEGSMNKWLASYTKMSLAYGPLITTAQTCMTNLGYKLSVVGFSVVPDQQGLCTIIQHSKKSGRQGAPQTGTYVRTTRSSSSTYFQDCRCCLTFVAANTQVGITKSDFRLV